MSVWSEIGNTALWLAVGLIFFVIGYKVLDWVLPLDLNQEIQKSNTAAGITVAGLFIAMGLIVAALVG